MFLSVSFLGAVADLIAVRSRHRAWSPRFSHERLSRAIFAMVTHVESKRVQSASEARWKEKRKKTSSRKCQLLRAHLPKFSFQLFTHLKLCFAFDSLAERHHGPLHQGDPQCTSLGPSDSDQRCQSDQGCRPWCCGRYWPAPVTVAEDQQRGHQAPCPL